MWHVEIYSQMTYLIFGNICQHVTTPLVWSMSGNNPDQRNNERVWWGLNLLQTIYGSGVLTTVSRTHALLKEKRKQWKELHCLWTLPSVVNSFHVRVYLHIMLHTYLFDEVNTLICHLLWSYHYNHTSVIKPCSNVIDLI